MKIRALLEDFSLYLEKNNNSENKYVSDSSSVSIFAHFSEFKKFLSQELKIDENIFTKSYNDIMSLEVVDGKLVTKEELEEQEIEQTTQEPQEDTQEETQEDEDNNLIIDILNNILEDENVISALDTDGNKTLDEQEIFKFLSEISLNDKDSENLSLDDVFSGIDSIEKPKETQETEETDTQKEDNIEETKQESTPAKTSSSYSGGGSYSGGTSSYSSSVAKQETQEKTLDNMTKDELNSELETAQNDLSQKQDSLNNIINGNDTKVSQMEEDVQEKYTTYQEELEKVDKKSANKVNELKTKIDTQQQAINKQELEIINLETSENEAQTNYQNAQSTKQTLENTLSQLQAQDTSNMEDDELSSHNSKISEVKAQIESAKQKEEEAQKSLEQVQKELEKAKETKETLKNELDLLNEEMTLLEAEILEKHSELKEYLDSYNSAKENAQSYKQNAIESARSSIKDSQNYISEIQSAINNCNNKELEKEYSPNPKSQYDEKAGLLLAQNALTTRGTTGYCLAGVSDTMLETFGVNFKNMGSAYLATEALRGNTPGYEELASHFVEVEVERSELANLPAGAVVVWDNNANGGGSNVSDAGKKHGHISIALGDGRESSDHIQAQQVNRDAEYTVFYPISL